MKFLSRNRVENSVNHEIKRPSVREEGDNGSKGIFVAQANGCLCPASPTHRETEAASKSDFAETSSFDMYSLLPKSQTLDLPTPASQIALQSCSRSTVTNNVADHHQATVGAAMLGARQGTYANIMLSLGAIGAFMIMWNMHRKIQRLEKRVFPQPVVRPKPYNPGPMYFIPDFD